MTLPYLDEDLGVVFLRGNQFLASGAQLPRTFDDAYEFHRVLATVDDDVLKQLFAFKNGKAQPIACYWAGLHDPGRYLDSICSSLRDFRHARRIACYTLAALGNATARGHLVAFLNDPQAYEHDRLVEAMLVAAIDHIDSPELLDQEATPREAVSFALPPIEPAHQRARLQRFLRERRKLLSKDFRAFLTKHYGPLTPVPMRRAPSAAVQRLLRWQMALAGAAYKHGISGNSSAFPALRAFLRAWPAGTYLPSRKDWLRNAHRPLNEELTALREWTSRNLRRERAGSAVDDVLGYDDHGRW